MSRHYFFVHRSWDPAQIDFRCPIGAVSVAQSTSLEVMRHAWLKARRRFPCRPREVLMLDEVRDASHCQQARMMERDWERAFADFKKLMTVN
jgi:hypothetical protein